MKFLETLSAAVALATASQAVKLDAEAEWINDSWNRAFNSINTATQNTINKVNAAT